MHRSKLGSRPIPRLLSAIALLFAIVWLQNCSSGGPKMSGFAFGETRVVRVGETVELRIPINERGEREWRVTSYDSLYLAIVEQPQFERAGNGRMDMVVRAKARRPGETVVELKEAVPAAQSPGSVRFRVRILE